MVTYEQADEKKAWGIRCTESAYNELWIGKSGSVQFAAVFPGLSEKILKKLRESRGQRTGAFWINPVEKTITIVTDDSVESGEYPQIHYDP